MTLTAGTIIGPYEILSPLGAGGLGEVYRAKDSRLGRDVAIKVLPAGFAADGERLKRFELEARATSALNHPNILTVYDIGTHDGAPYLVAELLEGETLREKLTGPLPPRKAVEWAIQMAHGLAAAHEKGIVHRDLKPENLFITKDGRLKILDFGLAKLTGPVVQPAGGDDTPTRSVGTAAGVVMGTVGYMSPEQVRGEAVDARSDIFAFGTILYEMISGKRAFKGNSAVETMNAILTVEPPEFLGIEPLPPPGLERLARHCLEKPPEARFQSARDLAFHLEAVSGMSGSGTRAITAKQPVRRNPSVRHWLITLLLCVLAAAAAAIYFRRAPQTRHPVRSTLLPPDKIKFELEGPNEGSLVISPDGQKLVFVAETQDKKQPLWVRSLDSLTAQPLAGTDDAIYPFWSPDSRFIAFFADGKLKKIEATGGPVTTLCDTPEGYSGSWGTGNQIIFISKFLGPLIQIPAMGGTPSPVVLPQDQEKDLLRLFPAFLPEGQHYLYLRPTGEFAKKKTFAIYAASLDGKTNVLVTESESNAVYASGHLLYMRGGTLLAQSFDLKRLKVTGEPLTVADSVDYRGGRFMGIFTVSQNGVLLYQSVAVGKENLVLTWVDRKGNPVGHLGQQAPYEGLRISPDGKRVAVAIRDPVKRTADLWIYEVARGLKTRLTFDDGYDQNPVWSPDSRRIVFNTIQGDGKFRLNEIAADGSGGVTQLLESKYYLVPSDWSSDGRWIAFFERDQTDDKKWNLFGLRMEGDHKPSPILATGIAKDQARFSPDGKWLAYNSDLSGKDEIYVSPFPGPGGRTLVATDFSGRPYWGKDGKALIFTTLDSVMEADVKLGAAVNVGIPRTLFPGKFLGQDWNFDITPDDQRFLVAMAPEKSTTPPPVNLVTNWDVDLKK